MKGTGSLSAVNAAHQVRTRGQHDVTMVLTGPFVATLVAEYSLDNGANWRTAAIQKSDGTIVQSVTAVGTYLIIALPSKSVLVRARLQGYTSGAVGSTLTL